MLTIQVPMSEELFDEATGLFIPPDFFALDLEHSLVSLSKWESNFEKPFLGAESKSPEEILWYFEAMTLTPNVPPEVFQRFSEDNIKAIDSYIQAKMSATTFAEQRSGHEVITSEIMYYWLVAYKIPFECQYWHLNRMIMLCRVIMEKNKPPRKMSPHEIAQQNRELNRQRREALGTTG